MSYCLEGLQHCGPLMGRPEYIPVSRPRGVKARGKTFEKRVGQVLQVLFDNVHSGRWFEYRDRARSGVCQIDHFVVLPDRVILVECKLSEVELAWEQMSRLYAPILERLYSRPVARVQACRYIRSGRRMVSDPRRALVGEDALWHVLV